MKQRNTVVAKLWLYGLMLTAAGCGRGHTLFGNLLLNPPVITDTLPATVTGPSLVVHGTRDPSTAVYIVFEGSSSQGTLLAASAASGTWEGTVNLQQGDNTFHLYGSTSALQSANSNNYALGRVPLPPGVTAPAVASTQTGTTQVTGTKEANTSISMTDPNGVTSTIIPTDATTSWTQLVTIANGNNTFAFEASNAKYSSTATDVTIFGSPLTAPLFRATSPTNQANQTIVGTGRNSPADQNATLWLVLDGGAPVQVQGPVSSPPWSYALSLGADGNHTVTTYEIDPVTNFAGPSYTAVIVLKTTVPPSPSISSPTLPWADVGNANFTITGSTQSGSFVCVAATPQGTCVATGPASGGAFSVTVTLQPGSNTLYISSRDTAGNISTEVVGTVYLESPPILSNEAPAEGATIVGLTFNGNVTVVPATADTGRAGAAIHSVTMSLDGGTAVSPSASNSNYTYAFTLPTGTAVGSTHTLKIVATDVAGATATYVANFVYSDGSAVWVSKDNTGYPDSVPSSAIDANGTLHVMWQSYCMTNPATCTVGGRVAPDIYYSQRTKDGNWHTITVASAVDGTDQLSTAPAIAVDPNSGNVHVLWAETGTANGKSVNQQVAGIVHRVFTPKTNTWSAIHPLSSDASQPDFSPVISIDANGLVHAAWYRQSLSTPYAVFYARFSGSAWTAELPVTPTTGTIKATNPSIAAAANGSAIVTWMQCDTSPNTCTGTNQDHDVYMRQVTSATQLGYGPITVSNHPKVGGADGDSTFPGVVVDPSTGTNWVFWFDTTSQATNTIGTNIFYRTYDSNGTAPGNSYTQVTTDTTATNPASPPLAVALGPVANGASPIGVAWGQELSDGVTVSIWARAGMTSDVTSLTPGTYYVSPSPTEAISPAMAVDANGTMYVSWTDLATIAGQQNVQQVYFDPVFTQ